MSHREIVAFRVSQQEYGIDIMTVREIRCWTPATPLPHSPPFVRGVINLRGAVLPVIDMAARFGSPLREATSRDVVMVVQNGSQVIGLLVDGVADILSVPPESLQPTPAVSSGVTETYIDCVATIEGRMIQLVKLEAIFDLGTREAA